MAIRFRNDKGSPLTYVEMDNNLGQFYGSSSVAGATITLFSEGTGSGDGVAKTHSLDVDPFPYTGDAVITGSLVVTGDVTAQTFNTEFVSSSIIYESGSTKFGDDVGDAHDFTGSLNISGSSNVVGTLSVNNTGSNSVNIDSGYIILTEVSESLNFANDTAAGSAGVPLGGLYHSNGFVKIRVT